MVKGVRIPHTVQPDQPSLSHNSFSCEEQQAITNELTRLLSKHIVEPTEHSQGKIISPIFVREKKDGQYRMILNLKQFNTSVEYEHFKMDTIKTITHFLVKDCYMASIDLKDAYYCVAVHQSDRKFLRFTWLGKLYQFTCLPNGLSCCPRLFTKLLEAPLAALHKLGHIASNYIDDLYLQGNTYEACTTNVIDTVTQFDALGFVSHPDKPAFQPYQQLIILGFLIISNTMTIQLTKEKAEDIKLACEHLLDISTCEVREVAKVIGKLVASFPGIMFGSLYYRALERDKSLALKENSGKYKVSMTLSGGVNLELQWWVTNVLTSYNVISHRQYDEILTTDASLIGWGAVYKDYTEGMWSDVESKCHINALELRAIYLGLQTYFRNTDRMHIRIMTETDNTTAVATLNKMGTSHSTLCTR